MDKYAVVENDIITNIIIWDGVQPLPNQWELIINNDGFLKIGMERINGEWVEPENTTNEES